MIDETDLGEFVRGKWYEPITTKIEEFERDADVFFEIAAVAEPNSPDWAVQCAIKGIKPFGNLAGFPFNGSFGANNVGALVGAKSSICGAMANTHKWALGMKADVRNKFVEAFGEEDVREAEVVWRRFAEKLHPEFATRFA